MNQSAKSDGVALGGYDAVAYFDQGAPARGTPEHAVEHAGETWLFASEEHARAFRETPDRYVPAYGGQCAFAASLGKIESGDPRRWQVSDGRLFLNSNPVAHFLWRVLPGRRAAADRRWHG